MCLQELALDVGVCMCSYTWLCLPWSLIASDVNSVSPDYNRDSGRAASGVAAPELFLLGVHGPEKFQLE